MYTGEILASMKKVEAARDANLAFEPRRMTAEEKDALLAAFHPDYKESQFETLRIGVSRGDKVPHELAALLQGKPRIGAGDADLSKIDYDDYESLQYLQRVLQSSGIDQALQDNGIEDGDTVSLYDIEFDYVT